MRRVSAERSLPPEVENSSIDPLLPLSVQGESQTVKTKKSNIREDKGGKDRTGRRPLKILEDPKGGNPETDATRETGKEGKKRK